MTKAEAKSNYEFLKSLKMDNSEVYYVDIPVNSLDEYVNNNRDMYGAEGCLAEIRFTGAELYFGYKWEVSSVIKTGHVEFYTEVIDVIENYGSDIKAGSEIKIYSDISLMYESGVVKRIVEENGIDEQSVKEEVEASKGQKSFKFKTDNFNNSEIGLMFNLNGCLPNENKLFYALIQDRSKSTKTNVKYDYYIEGLVTVDGESIKDNMYGGFITAKYLRLADKVYERVKEIKSKG
ncbi:MAG: hypothetical protein J5879_07745 [Clostridia bacterium]|nr:hypothetical protein [Clostridia bacterium]